MKIQPNPDSVNNSLGSLYSNTSVAGASAASVDSSVNAGVGGNVSGDDMAQVSLAANLVSLAASADDVRSDKVASIQAALQAGTYDVSPQMVASKIVDSMLQ